MQSDEDEDEDDMQNQKVSEDEKASSNMKGNQSKRKRNMPNLDESEKTKFIVELEKKFEQLRKNQDNKTHPLDLTPDEL